MNTRRFFLLILNLAYSFFMFGLWAASNDAVSMVKFEQNWSDGESTITLKNNTQEDIRNVAFRIIYYDMAGTQLDYRDFKVNINIEPGLSRQVKVKAFGHDRSFHYYKTPDNMDQPTFKVSYVFKGFQKAHSSIEYSNLQDFEVPETGMALDDYGRSGAVVHESSRRDYLNGTYSEMEPENSGLIWSMVIVLVILAVIIGFWVLVAVMAKERNRDVILWLIVAFFISPIITAFILLAVGDDKKKE